MLKVAARNAPLEIKKRRRETGAFFFGAISTQSGKPNT
jgi:hypothetical protein